jgi:deoxyribodipyrimidine photolyase-related protein
VDDYDWVMLLDVVGMSQYADGVRMTTKPYTSGGAYVHRMSDLCAPCVYRPGDRTGEHACPYTAGHWAFLHRHRDLLPATSASPGPCGSWTGSPTSRTYANRNAGGATHHHEIPPVAPLR